MGEMDAVDAVSKVDKVFPGAEVMVNIASRLNTPAATRGEQARMRGWVARCTDCDDDGIAGTRGERIAPTYRVHHASYVAVLGSGGDSTRKLLATAARNAKVPGQDAAAEVMVVACATGRNPNDAERHRCWGNCHDAMWHANTDRVLLVGAKAKDLWRPDLTMDEMRGVVGVMWDRYVAMVIDDPAGVLTVPAAERRRYGLRLTEHMERWAEVVGEGGGRSPRGDGPLLPITRHMALRCVKCERDVDWVDRDGLGWCREHRTTDGAMWLKVRGGVPGTGVQETML